jgi:hypothetical protein
MQRRSATEGRIMAEKCAHQVCYCEPSGGDYCGDHCRGAEAKGGSGPTCECGHIDCEEATMRAGGVYTTSADDA